MRGTGQRTDNGFGNQCRESLHAAKCPDSACFLSLSIRCVARIRGEFRRSGAASQCHQLQRHLFFCCIPASATRSTTAGLARTQEAPDSSEQDARSDCKNQQSGESLPVHTLIVRRKPAFDKASLTFFRRFTEDWIQMALKIHSSRHLATSRFSAYWSSFTICLPVSSAFGIHLLEECFEQGID